MNGGSFFGTDSSLNYPFGSANSNPILIDAILAGIAMIGTSLGMATVKAASLTLGTFSLACGTLAIIPMFLLGKEVVGTKKAGYIAALFLAFCPIVITQTVFSNGTETGWILLLFLILSLLVFKGLKSIVVSTHTEDKFKETIIVNRSAVRTAAIAGPVLALIVLSTNNFRPIVVLLVISLVGYSAMAGTVGGGGVGDIAIRYGYQQYKTDYLIVCSIILIAFVQLIQMIGNSMYKKMS